MNKEIAIRLQDVTKTYYLYNSHADRVKEAFHPFRRKYNKPYHALDGVSLDIYKGEFVGIIGRNGSGKSTMLQLISGILQPSIGSIQVDGTISALLELGAGFNPEFTGRENVFLNASILGITNEETQSRFAEIADFADIGDFIDQPVKTYSSGMYVRLAFAVAVSVKPDILIVDEALAVGDMFFQQKCIRYMEKVMVDCTKVLVTHDMHAVMNLCERVAVLDNGELAFTGSPLESVEHYTKKLHNDLYSDSSDNKKQIKDQYVEKKAVSTHFDDHLSWTEVKSESIAGASKVLIKKVCLTSPDNKPFFSVQPGDQILIHMGVDVLENIPDPIFGYMVKDRVGNGLCGDNSLSLEKCLDGLQQGSYEISFTISWPDIAPNDYLVTLGVGQGDHPLNHVIQCWAHNVLLIKAVSPGKIVHGLFTNAIIKCEVNLVG